MSLAIFIVTSVILILSIIIKPKLFKLDTYVLVAALGAVMMILCKQITLKEIYNSLFHNELISPIKIMILFITMTFLSIVCDSLGLFKYIAYKVVDKCKNGQIKLFSILYILISLITIFTSNDIIILTFTPFIIYFCKRANINPIPYLVSEFVAANTASMMLIVGNPTNILLSLANKITFIEYLSHMWYIALLTSVFLYFLLLLVFYKKLKEPITVDLTDKAPKLNKFLVIVSTLHLITSTVLLAISSYIGLEMYLITSILAASLLVILLIYILLTRSEGMILYKSLARLPYALIPFLISMFILVEALNVNGFTLKLYNALAHINKTYSYGISSYLMCNVMNNIPMSVLYSNTLQYGASNNMIYASIIGSNIGAYLTPLGALAGIMWLNILKAYKVKFTFRSFLFYGVIISIPAILFATTLLLI